MKKYIYIKKKTLKKIEIGNVKHTNKFIFTPLSLNSTIIIIYCEWGKKKEISGLRFRKKKNK